MAAVFGQKSHHGLLGFPLSEPLFGVPGCMKGCEPSSGSPKSRQLLRKSTVTDTVIETATRKVLKEEGTLEVLPLSYGGAVPTFISALPFVCYLIEVPRMWTLAGHRGG